MVIVVMPVRLSNFRTKTARTSKDTCCPRVQPAGTLNRRAGPSRPSPSAPSRSKHRLWEKPTDHVPEKADRRPRRAKHGRQAATAAPEQGRELRSRARPAPEQTLLRRPAPEHMCFTYFRASGAPSGASAAPEEGLWTRAWAAARARAQSAPAQPGP